MRRHFITGAGGFLGRNLLEELLKKTEDEFYLLYRSDSSKRKLEELLIWADPERITYLKGDIKETDLNLSRKDLELFKKADYFWHIAASTSFDDKQKKDIINTNIQGTNNVLDLAKKNSNLSNFYYISTAYVAGLNQGRVYEDEMPQKVGFRNSYEESKYESESLVRKSNLPWTIFRPSIVIGDSRTYDSQGEKRMIYGYMLAIYYSLLKEHSKKELVENWKKRGSMEVNLNLIGLPEISKNFICIDDVVGIIKDVFDAPNSLNKTYHLTNNYIQVEDIREIIEISFRIKGIKSINPPENEYKNLKDNDKRAYLFTKPFIPYLLNEDPLFDTTNVDSTLKEHKKINLDKFLFTKLMECFVENDIIKKIEF